MNVSHRIRTPILGLFGLALITWTAGCAIPTKLRPAPGADAAAWLDQAAVSEIDDVEVVAQANAWPGDPEVATQVTPIRVKLDNGGDEAVRVRYQEFALVAEDGTRYAALPPFRIDGEVTERVTVHDADPVFDPRFVHDDYFISDTVGPTWYPNYAVYAGPFDRDVYYYDHYHEYWLDRDLPTPAMLANVIPEGVVGAGGSVEGYLYFEKVDNDHDKVRFRADLVSADDNDVFGEVSIPFVVN